VGTELFVVTSRVVWLACLCWGHDGVMEAYVCTNEVQGCVVRDRVPLSGLCATGQVRYSRPFA
jgi:hypothetical protein